MLDISAKNMTLLFRKILILDPSYSAVENVDWIERDASSSSSSLGQTIPRLQPMNPLTV